MANDDIPSDLPLVLELKEARQAHLLQHVLELEALLLAHAKFRATKSSD